MTEKQLGLLIVTPMIAGTAALLKRQGALGGAAQLFITTLSIAISAFLFLT